SPDFLPHIFEPFRQADSSPARSAQGLGLGLAIARHLVESHGGIIRAESAGVGRGTSVTVLLPVPPLAGETGPPTETHAVARVKPDPALLEGVRVMVVEDEADSREILSTMLREWGADVTTAPSAPEALNALAAEAPARPPGRAPPGRSLSAPRGRAGSRPRRGCGTALEARVESRKRPAAP